MKISKHFSILAAFGGLILGDGIRRVYFGKNYYERLNGIIESILGGVVIVASIETYQRLNATSFAPWPTSNLHECEEDFKRKLSEKILSQSSKNSDQRSLMLYLKSSGDPKKIFKPNMRP